MKKYLSIIFIIAFLILVSLAEAAELNFIPEEENFSLGQEFFVDVKLNTNDDSINAVQSTVTYPKDKLEAIGTEKLDSVFNFWAEEPIIFNDKGVLGFIGGTSKGASGDSLQILRIKFKAIGVGIAEIGMYDSAVTANDGKGTNVLSSVKNTTISIGEKGEKIIEPEPVVSQEDSISGEAPQKIERTAVSAKNLPEAPSLRISLYPDASKWYNHQGETFVFWNIENDTTNVAISINNNPKSEPNTAEDKLFTGKNIGILGEGIHYVHVQFKNSLGWGKTTHYKIAIDTTSPTPFDAQISSSISDNPTPEIKYTSSDSLSGYSHSLITIDDNEPIRSTSKVFILPPQKPGEHSLTIKIFDKAENSTEDDLSFEILPLEMPKIEFLTENILKGEKVLVFGESIPNSFVDLKILKGDSEQVSVVANTDAFGDWKAFFEGSLPKGNYVLIASARNEKGAISYETEPYKLKVGAKSIISFGSIGFNLSELLIVIILMILLGVGLREFYCKKEIKKEENFITIVEKDVKKIGKLLENSLTTIEKTLAKQKKMQGGLRPKIKSTIEKMRKDIKKMQG
ncbi:hypothetical protein KKG48_02140 [Patescibacteria group bacterium]|nr:hypothetical protein [Patescibacteria group bacterium]